jgi:hypothetical protein
VFSLEQYREMEHYKNLKTSKELRNPWNFSVHGTQRQKEQYRNLNALLSIERRVHSLERVEIPLYSIDGFLLYSRLFPTIAIVFFLFMKQ